MQPVNVLPTFVSQDTDLKNKDSSASAESSGKDIAFSRMVDEHVGDDNKKNTDQGPQGKVESTTATNSNTVAESGKKDIVEKNGRQETDSADVELTAKEHSGYDGDNTHEISPNVEDESVDNKNSKNTEALTESEQFISLLYNSDQALKNTADKTGQVSGDNHVNKEVISTAVKGEAGSENNVIEDGVNTKVKGKPTEPNVSTQTFEHKLKAFSKGELLSRAQLKENTIAQQSGERVLKDYQESLQTQKNTIKNPSITSEQLMNTQLADAQLKNNKVTDLATSISQVNKNKLTENKGPAIYQLPVEPIGKEDIAGGDASITVKDSVANNAARLTESNVSTAIRNQGKSSVELPVESTEEALAQAKEKANPLLDLINDKANNDKQKLKAPSDNLLSSVQSSKVNTDKIITERNSSVSVMAENNAKEQTLEVQVKQPALTPSQILALQQAKEQQKIQSVNSDADAIESAGEEFVDSMLSSNEIKQDENVKKLNTLNGNVTTRSLLESQAQSIQATQTKQSNDAYNEHQTSELLNHSVASDTAQIQKNNVQLQQETIAIFKKDFADAVKDKVMIMVNQKLQQFDITLDPPEFGNMQVRVNLQGEQASVNFVVQNQQAKDALEENMHKLKEMLAEQGVDVGGANVEQQNQQQKDETNLEQGNANTSSTSQNEEENNDEHVLSAKLFDSSATGVDYYA